MERKNLTARELIRKDLLIKRSYLKAQLKEVDNILGEDMKKEQIETVYVAGPLTTGNLMENVHKAVLAGDRLMEAGYVPFIPHLSALHSMIVGRADYEEWMKYDFFWVRKCDSLLRLPGVSSGADREVELATKLKKPVFYDILELLRLKTKPPTMEWLEKLGRKEMQDIADSLNNR